MKTPDDVVAIVRLHQLGWGTRRIAKELGIARSTVIHFVREGGWKPYKRPDRVRCLQQVDGDRGAKQVAGEMFELAAVRSPDPAPRVEVECA